MLLKITEKIIQENAFEQRKKETRVKFNPRLSANRPSKNWARLISLSDKTGPVTLRYRSKAGIGSKTASLHSQYVC